MNGVYNGQFGDSHRARIPSTANIAVTTEGVKVTGNTYRLDVSQGEVTQVYHDNVYIGIRVVATVGDGGRHSPPLRFRAHH